MSPMSANLLLTELSDFQPAVGLPRAPGGGEGGRAAATHTNVAAPWSGACRMGKTNYSHDAMIDLIITHPGISQKDLAAHFGYTPAWVSAVFASDAFQAKLAKRREEIIDPEMRASLKERAEALYRRSLDILMEKLDKPAVSDNVALKAAELGAKALGIGGHAPPSAPPPAGDRLVILADRLVALKGNIYENAKSINGEVPDAGLQPAEVSDAVPRA